MTMMRLCSRDACGHRKDPERAIALAVILLTSMVPAQAAYGGPAPPDVIHSTPSDVSQRARTPATKAAGRAQDLLPENGVISDRDFPGVDYQWMLRNVLVPPDGHARRCQIVTEEFPD